MDQSVTNGPSPSGRELVGGNPQILLKSRNYWHNGCLYTL